MAVFSATPSSRRKPGSMDTAPFALVRHRSLFASMDPGVRRDDEGAVVAPLEDARLGFYVAARCLTHGRHLLLIARRAPTHTVIPAEAGIHMPCGFGSIAVVSVSGFPPSRE